MAKRFKATIDDPVMRIEWVDAQRLRPNAWNPNAVLRAELRLLEVSILTNGWVQPILVNPHLLIIDGYHRWRLAQESRALSRRYRGQVPVAKLAVPDEEAKMLTVRINRAKGTHVAVRMAEVVKQLIDDHGLLPEEVARGIGATLEEVDLLYQDSIFTSRNLAEAPYSRAWYPAESRAKSMTGE